MVSRRAVLGGAAAVAAGGATAAVEAGWWGKALHRIGWRESPDHHAPPSGVLVHSDSFVTAAMPGMTVGWSIAVPTVAPVAVVVCLHGAFDDHRLAFRDLHLHDVVAEAHAPLVVASVDGGSRSYWHRRADGLDPQRMLFEDFLPRVDAYVGRQLPRVLLGWSMGGYGAVLIAEDRPRELVGVCAASPGLFASYAQAPKPAFDGRADFESHDVFPRLDRLDRLRTRVDCGTGDPFIDEARKLAAALHHPEGTFGPGYHDHAYWRSIAPAQIASIARWVR